MFKTLQWEDWVGVALGLWLLASPWVVGFSGEQAATMNALFMGTVLVLEEFLDLGVHEMAEEWIDVVAGLWLVISPVVLGFAGSMVPSMNAVAVGLLTVLFAAWAASPLDEQIDRWWHGTAAGH